MVTISSSTVKSPRIFMTLVNNILNRFIRISKPSASLYCGDLRQKKKKKTKAFYVRIWIYFAYKIKF